jgi:hypothetical protein
MMLMVMLLFEVINTQRRRWRVCRNATTGRPGVPYGLALEGRVALCTGR